MELHCKKWGVATGGRSPLLLLHGMGGTGALWRPIAASFESSRVVLAPDQRGHGQSRNVPDQKYSPIQMGKDVWETLEREKIGNVFVIGHSMGVRTAAALAHLIPHRVEGLVLIDLGFFGPAGGGLGLNLAHFLKNLPTSFRSRANARSYLESHAPDPAMAQYLLAVAVQAPNKEITFPFDHDALIQIIYAVENFSLRPWIEEFAATGKPVLALRGGESRVWTAEEFAAERARFDAHQNIRFEVIEGAGHGLPFDKRKEFVQLLKNTLVND